MIPIRALASDLLERCADVLGLGRRFFKSLAREMHRCARPGEEFFQVTCSRDVQMCSAWEGVFSSHLIERCADVLGLGRGFVE
jgi:hypothetical protein